MPRYLAPEANVLPWGSQREIYDRLHVLVSSSMTERGAAWIKGGPRATFAWQHSSTLYKLKALFGHSRALRLVWKMARRGSPFPPFSFSWTRARACVCVCVTVCLWPCLMCVRVVCVCVCVWEREREVGGGGGGEEHIHRYTWQGFFFLNNGGKKCIHTTALLQTSLWI